MCYDSNARVPVPPGPPGAAQGEDTVLTAADGTRFSAYLARPAGETRATSAAVVIYPDIRGLHQFYKDLAVRFAEQGITALAIDYFGRTAGLTARDDAFEYRPHVEQMRLPSFQADVEAALAHLRGLPNAPTRSFTVGFCMGGTLSFLIGTQAIGLAGVVGYYAGMSRDFGGGGTLLDRATQIKVPALGLFGGDDPGIPVEKVEQFDRELDRAGVPHEVVVYPGAPHSFFDRRWTDFAEASADSWRRVLAFISTQG